MSNSIVYKICEIIILLIINILTMKNLVPIAKIRSLTLIVLMLLSAENSWVFSQCSTTNLVTENFNGFSGGATTQADINTYLALTGATAGQYTNNVKGITDDAKSITCGVCGWKRNSSNCATGASG